MTKAQQAVLAAMNERGEATRPQLAAATGLSLVSVSKAVATLCHTGELKEAGELPSGGGRPVQLYRYNAGYALHTLIQAQREDAMLRCTLQLLDLHGNERSHRAATFAYLEKESLDGLLSEALRGRRLRSITLMLPDGCMPDGMLQHLTDSYNCRVCTPTAAAILAQSSHEGTATVCLMEGTAPTCAMMRHGVLQESGPLHLLPLPADWSRLDYSDRSLVEEMVARLLLIITCTLAPDRIELFTPAISSRLTERIRYNAATKLKGALPPLHFSVLSPEWLEEATLSACTNIT